MNYPLVVKNSKKVPKFMKIVKKIIISKKYFKTGNFFDGYYDYDVIV